MYCSRYLFVYCDDAFQVDNGFERLRNAGVEMEGGLILFSS